jgi:cell division protein FtsI (penicillin-binding protein 3)
VKETENPTTKDKNWCNFTSVDGFRIWSCGYALQTLTLYNAVNNGRKKPQFVSEIKEWNKTIKKYETNKLLIRKDMFRMQLSKKLNRLCKCVKRGTGSKLYSKDFSMSGKTETTPGKLWNNGGKQTLYIIIRRVFSSRKS